MRTLQKTEYLVNPLKEKEQFGKPKALMQGSQLPIQFSWLVMKSMIIS
jgi:hypothetical protein